jgi:hypothetical protein
VEKYKIEGSHRLTRLTVCGHRFRYKNGKLTKDMDGCVDGYVRVYLFIKPYMLYMRDSNYKIQEIGGVNYTTYSHDEERVTLYKGDLEGAYKKIKELTGKDVGIDKRGTVFI